MVASHARVPGNGCLAEFDKIWTVENVLDLWEKAFAVVTVGQRHGAKLVRANTNISWSFLVGCNFLDYPSEISFK